MESFTVAGAEDEGLYMPMWSTQGFRLSNLEKTVSLIFIGDEEVVDARHHFTGEHLDDFLIGCQAAMASSGPNYRPFELNTNEEMAEVEFLGSGVRFPGRRVCQLDPSNVQ